MTAKDQTQVVRDHVEAFNAADWDGVKATMARDCVYNEIGTGRRLQGTEQIVQAYQGWRQAFPDVKGRITNAVPGGGTAVFEVTWEGTHTGPLVGPGGTIPASGKRQVTPSAWVVMFEGDKIKESRHYFDMLSLLQQIGAVPR